MSGCQRPAARRPGGSAADFYSPDIEDYYFTPWGASAIGNVVKFDHDFVGREALERTAGDDHRRKVTLAWDAADVARVVEASHMRPEETPALYIEFPRATYATWQYDAVHDGEGRTMGASTYTGFSWNERAMLSLAVVEPEYATPGHACSVLWGEPEGGAKSHAAAGAPPPGGDRRHGRPGPDRDEIAAMTATACSSDLLARRGANWMDRAGAWRRVAS